jgi:hypothetical protein
MLIDDRVQVQRSGGAGDAKQDSYDECLQQNSSTRQREPAKTGNRRQV